MKEASTMMNKNQVAESKQSKILQPLIISQKKKQKKKNVFGELVSTLEEIGYVKGFSLAAIPNDYRKFISSNTFAYEALNYHIDQM